MPRIHPVDQTSATGKTAELLQAVEKKMGKVPNLLATFANSPAVLQAYLNLSGALAGGSLSGKIREQIALAVGETNQCGYCLAAHSALGKQAGLSDDEVMASRRGQAGDPKANAAITLARRIVDERGWVKDEDLEAARQGGLTDGEMSEVVANVALNIFTNYFNHVAGTEVDFPHVPELGSK